MPPRLITYTWFHADLMDLPPYALASSISSAVRNEAPRSKSHPVPIQYGSSQCLLCLMPKASKIVSTGEYPKMHSPRDSSSRKINEVSSILSAQSFRQRRNRLNSMLFLWFMISSPNIPDQSTAQIPVFKAVRLIPVYHCSHRITIVKGWPA